MQARCFAKINLFLRIVGRRPDGFHELETVFQTINLADELKWNPNQGSLALHVTNGPDFGQDNLVWKAVRAYASKTRINPRGKITLSKKIPVGGGLGGGSSNAAMMLKLLNEFYELLSMDQLHELALDLGSDVPFFLEQGRLWGYGRGEKLMPCHWKLPVTGGFLFLPPFGIPTGDVFRRLQVDLLAPEDVAYATPGESSLGKNDLEEPACKVNPLLGDHLQQLRHSLPGETVFMSGSGSTLIWLTNDRALPTCLRSFGEQTRTTVLPFSFEYGVF